MLSKQIKFGDLFAGGGGTTTGALSVPGIYVAWGINHDPKAIELNSANHPETRYYTEDITTQDITDLEPVDCLWASLECTEHSKAKGGRTKNVGSFMLGWSLMRYIVHCKPEIIIIENVPEFVKWGKLKNGKRVKITEGTEYQKWRDAVKKLGYPNYEYKFMNAADYGCPTRRVRYIGIFTQADVMIQWPAPTHNEKEGNIWSLPKWKPCKTHLKLEKEGESIFGRKKPLCHNTLKRIAGGIKKFAPEMHMILKYYGNGHNCQSINEPLHTIRTKHNHALIKVEKMNFITDHCHSDYHDSIDDPLRTVNTQQTKQLITVKKEQFITKYYGGRIHAEPLDKPFPTITTVNNKALVTVERKHQFITTYFNSNGQLTEYQNQSCDRPLNSITTNRKNALITGEVNDLIDFDIKMRFLDEEELSSIMGFPKHYFKKPNIKLNKKEIFKMIGNAVPVELARVIIESAIDPLLIQGNLKTA